MAMPATLPTTGGETMNLWLVALLAGGLALVGASLFLRSRSNELVK
jgi:LPXTG-motif cell wall-anchored protein